MKCNYYLTPYKKLYLDCCSLWIRNMDHRKNEVRVINAFKTWCWRRMLKIKWTDRIRKDEFFQRVKEERLPLKIKENRCHSWIGHKIKHKYFVVNIDKGAMFGIRGGGKTSTAVLHKAILQKHRTWQLYGYEKNDLQ